VTRRRGKVLVLGQDDRSFLATIRSLGRHGVEVHVAWCPPDAVALRSRYVRAAHVVPPYSPTSATWIEALRHLCARERYDLVLPTNDQTVVPLQRHRTDLADVARLYVLPDVAADVVFDKERCSRLASSLDVPIAAQTVLPLPADVDDVVARHGLPLVLKPRTSYRWDDLTERRPVRVPRTRAALAAALAEYDGLPDVLVEEYFEGRGGGVDVLVREGEVLFTFQHVRLHEGHTYRGAPYRVTERPTPAIAAAAQRFFGALQYTGVAMFEFLEHPDGRWIMIDVNARFWAALPLAVAAGADVPFYLYEMLVHDRRDFPPGYRGGLYGRNWNRDVLWFREQHRQAGWPRVFGAEVLRAAWRSLTLQERSDTLVLDDPMPGLVDLGRLARRLADRRRRT